MSALLTTLPLAAQSVQRNQVLHQEGFVGSVVDLPQGSALESDARTILERVVFVLAGEAIVTLGGVNTLLGRDQAFLIGAGRDYELSASPRSAARLLLLEVPARRVITPPLETLTM